jgi:hypothetical protein
MVASASVKAAVEFHYFVQRSGYAWIIIANANFQVVARVQCDALDTSIITFRQRKKQPRCILPGRSLRIGAGYRGHHSCGSFSLLSRRSGCLSSLTLSFIVR